MVDVQTYVLQSKILMGKIQTVAMHIMVITMNHTLLDWRYGKNISMYADSAKLQVVMVRDNLANLYLQELNFY